MSPEPAELQILRQILGHERGGDVFALYTMAASLAQQAQQVAEQAQAIEQMRPAAEPSNVVPMTAPSENPWTGPDIAQEGP